jgi:CIC family chloride channel protein
MTLSYDIIMPLMLCSVVAYYTARGIEDQSLYSEALNKKAAAEPARMQLPGVVADLVRGQASSVSQTARFDEIASQFLASRQEEIYVTHAGRYVGVISLHDIKPHLSDPEVAAHVIADDIRREDGPTVAPSATLADALRVFAQCSGQTLPVVEPQSKHLAGILVKNDLLLALLEGRSPANKPRTGGTVAPFPVKG